MMQYTEVTFRFQFAQEYEQDLFYQGLADMGFETFDEEKGYIQTALLDEDTLRAYTASKGQEIVTIAHCPDEDWNAAWEAEHPIMELPLDVRIVPHCAFGAGHHETTGMMIEELLKQDLTGQCVLDMGCGTGVLGIFAAKQGAAQVVAADIDDKSVDNTKENALLNDVELDVRLSGTVPEGQYDLIVANIHRNILLSMMSDFGRTCRMGGQLWLSGFYETDIVPLRESAQQKGFALMEEHANGEWRMIQLIKVRGNFE